MKSIAYTLHAEEAIVLRKLKKKDIEQCLTHPDEILPARSGTQLYIKDFGTKFLKVVVAEEANRFVVITTHWIAKKRYLR